MKLIRSSAVLAAVAALVFSGAGCGAPKTATISDETVPTGKTTYTTDTGGMGTAEMRGEGERLPEDFPKDFPIMPGLKVLSFTSMNQSEGSMTGGQWTTTASVGDVFSYYKNALSKNNWQVVNTSTYEATSFISFAKKDDERYAGSLTMEKQSDNSTTVTFSYMFIYDLSEIKKSLSGE